MANSRPLQRAERQLMLARIARRDAMGSLAQSLAEEQRSASLADRSRMLAKGYATREGLDTGDALTQHKRFAGELAGLARQADQACSDASRQTEWQVDVLAKAEQRIERLGERAKLARLEHRHTQERLEREEQAAMAHKLQNHLASRSTPDRSRKPR